METAEKQRNHECESKYVHLDGGWGYIIATSFVVFMLVSQVPVSSFGLYYGEFLASIGDKASGTALSTSILIATVSFIGFFSSFLLKKYSYRLVGLVGAVFYSVGGFSEVFSETLIQMIMGFSVLKGIGSGLMFASSLTILNDYFDKKHSFIMGISQTFITMSAIVCPLILSNAMEHMGFRNVLWLLAGISVLNFPAMAAFIPVKKCNEQNSAETSEKQVPPFKDVDAVRKSRLGRCCRSQIIGSTFVV
ncbi:monocarboxylate transporter 7-like [Leptinotarsa decemlineata]|uniref:monocarboxylate transporter 7-like n=1 Tax=Leptinotarsa decemlineata TaxID=7539 RepID=UPI003D3092B0